MERKKILAALHSQLDRYHLYGLKPSDMAERAAQLDALIETMDRKVDELEDLGVKVKDLELGLVDFPAERYGDKVLLCWMYGEPEVSYWHGPDEGYARRKALRMQLIQP